jgi:hypothetical protein
MVFLELIYFVIVLRAFELVSCEDTVNPPYLTAFPSVSCATSPDFPANFSVAIVALIVYGIGIPLTLSLYPQLTADPADAQARRRLEPITSRFRLKYWVGLQLAMRQLPLAAISAFLPDQPIAQAVVVMFVFVASFVVAQNVEPHKRKWVGWTELMAYLFAHLVTFAGLGFRNSSLGTDGMNVAVGAVIGVGALALVIMIIQEVLWFFNCNYPIHNWEKDKVSQAAEFKKWNAFEERTVAHVIYPRLFLVLLLLLIPIVPSPVERGSCIITENFVNI